jgi:hypothetical protein
MADGRPMADFTFCLPNLRATLGSNLLLKDRRAPSSAAVLQGTTAVTELWSLNAVPRRYAAARATNGPDPKRPPVSRARF